MKEKERGKMTNNVVEVNDCRRVAVRLNRVGGGVLVAGLSCGWLWPGMYQHEDEGEDMKGVK